MILIYLHLHVSFKINKIPFTSNKLGSIPSDYIFNLTATIGTPKFTILINLIRLSLNLQNPNYYHRFQVFTLLKEVTTTITKFTGFLVIITMVANSFRNLVTMVVDFISHRLNSIIMEEDFTNPLIIIIIIKEDFIN